MTPGAALIFFAALAAYWPALHGTILWDDPGHLTRPDLQPLHGLWRIWTEIGATQQYYPVLHSAFWLEHRLWGDDLFWYHVTNVALHSAAAFLLFLILETLAIPGALLAALIFAVHPVAVESVAWISEQKNTLSAVFYMAAALTYLKGRRFLPFALFLLALLSKSVTATLPIALLIVIWWQQGRLEWKRDVVPLIPWFAAAVVIGGFTAWVERTVIGAQGNEFSLTLLQRVLLSGRIFWFYAAKAVWPANLIFIYPRWTIDASQASAYLYTAGAIALGLACWLVRGRTRTPLAALLFFGVTLAPALGFVNAYPFLFSYVADHFQYLAMLGVIVPVAAVIQTRARSFAPFPLTLAPVLVLAVLTWRQSHIYASSETLYRETIARNPACWMCYLNLGTEAATDPNRLPEAAALFERTLALKPDHAQARKDLALAHIQMAAALAEQRGRAAEALAHFDRALEVDPKTAAAQAPLGAAIHLNLGTDLLDQDRVDAAIAEFRAALALQPDYFKAHFNLGTVLMDVPGAHAEAIAHLEAAVRLAPDNAAARANLAAARTLK